MQGQLCPLHSPGSLQSLLTNVAISFEYESIVSPTKGMIHPGLSASSAASLIDPLVDGPKLSLYFESFVRMLQGFILNEP